jgi:archaellum component FlaG (FlaF/FlaG flagellin family)
MMKRLLIVCAAVALAGTAAAGTISITISQAARIQGDNLNVDVKVGNSGDEAALSVTPVLRFGDKEVRGKGKASLEPKGSFDETLTLPVGPLGEGRWPYRLAVDYTDQNQYPFQALQTQTAIVGNPPPAKVAVPTIQSEEIAGTGTLTLLVKNLTPDTRTAKVSVLVPEGLEATDATRQVTLDAWKDASLEIPITNRTALVGSRYPVFVTAEYDDGPAHQAVVAQAVVSVVGADSFLDRHARLLRTGAIALVLAWLVGTFVVYLRRRDVRRA